MSSPQAGIGHIPMPQAEFAANSQTSSFVDSLQSHAFDHPLPQTSTIQTSQTSQSHLGGITPPTSVSNLSSQDCSTEGLRSPSFLPLPSTALSSEPLHRSGLSDVDRAQRSIAHTGTRENAHHVPAKRTAYGDIKRAERSPCEDAEVAQPRELRGSKTTLKDTSVAELSRQLRTRLSYAMIKVQNGWQGRTLGELEKISQPGSPISVTSELQRSLGSPQSSIQLEDGELIKSSGPPFSTPEVPHVAPYVQRGGSEHNRISPQMSDQINGAPTAHGGRTYESFWREHSMVSASRQAQAQHPASRPPSLAPPVDILPRTSWRTGVEVTQPFHSTCRSPKSRHGLAASTFAMGPTTPPGKSAAARTASQNAAMEKDAVETLLFLSSPNSSHRPIRSPISPARCTVPSPDARIGFSPFRDSRNGDSTTPASPFRYHHELPRSKGRISTADVDQFLDEMPDDISSSSSSSSSDEEEILPHQPLKRLHV